MVATHQETLAAIAAIRDIPDIAANFYSQESIRICCQKAKDMRLVVLAKDVCDPMLNLELAHLEKIFSDRKKHINEVHCAFTYSLRAWEESVSSRYYLENELENLVSKEVIQGYQLKAKSFQALWELVHASFPYLRIPSSFDSCSSDYIASHWKSTLIFRAILLQKISNAMAECFRPYYEFSRKRVAKEIKMVLDSNLLQPRSLGRKSDIEIDLSKLANGLARRNGYLQLVVEEAYNNPRLFRYLNSFLYSMRKEMEMAEKRTKRTRNTKNESMVSSYAWCLGEKKLGSQEGGCYK